MLAEGADRAGALGVIARPVRAVRPVQHRRILAQACRRDRSARPSAISCRRGLRPAPCLRRRSRWRNPARSDPARGAECRRNRARSTAASRRRRYGATSSEPAALTKCIETSPSAAAISAQSPTRPICPALRSATAARPDLLAFLDADPDRLRRDGLPVAELAVDHRQRRRIDHDFDGLVGNDRAHLLPSDIDRHPDHAVAVMPGEIGGREIGRDAPGFLGRGIRNGRKLPQRNRSDFELGS